MDRDFACSVSVQDTCQTVELTGSRSHDRAFLYVDSATVELKSFVDTAYRDAVATDIIHQHSGRLDYYKGYASSIGHYSDSHTRCQELHPILLDEVGTRP